jgi:hypothetical protein
VELKSNALICHVRGILVSEIVGSSEYRCSAGGKFCSHSTEFFVWLGNKISRFDIITLKNEIVDPIDEICFMLCRHLDNLSNVFLTQYCAGG